jgi:hypothetical protein
VTDAIDFSKVMCYEKFKAIIVIAMAYFSTSRPPLDDLKINQLTTRPPQAAEAGSSPLLGYGFDI